MTQRETVDNDQRQRRPAQDIDETLFDDADEPQDDEHKIFGLGILNADARQPAYGQGVVISLLTAGAVLLLAIISIGSGDGSDPPFSRTRIWCSGS